MSSSKAPQPELGARGALGSDLWALLGGAPRPLGHGHRERHTGFLLCRVPFRAPGGRRRGPAPSRGRSRPGGYRGTVHPSRRTRAPLAGSRRRGLPPPREFHYNSSPCRGLRSHPGDSENPVDGRRGGFQVSESPGSFPRNSHGWRRSARNCTYSRLMQTRA